MNTTTTMQRDSASLKNSFLAIKIPRDFWSLQSMMVALFRP